MRHWKRLLLAIVGGLLIMFADTLGLALVGRWYRPQHPPAWVTASFYYFLAWPLTITMRLFPRAPGDNFGGPTVLAVIVAGLIDLLLFTCLLYALLKWRAKKRQRA